MTEIIFVRHGESDANAYIHTNLHDPHLGVKIDTFDNPGLTETGHDQATIVGTYLANRLDKNYHTENGVYVLTSLFKSAIQTANPFVSTIKQKDTILAYDEDELLQEYSRPCKLGRGSGFSTHATWGEFTDKIETFVNVLENMAQCSTRPIVIFGHSLFLSAMTSYIGSQKTFMPDKSQLVFRFPNASITTFCYNQGQWKILCTASIAHLPPDFVTGTETPFATKLFFNEFKLQLQPIKRN